MRIGPPVNNNRSIYGVLSSRVNPFSREAMTAVCRIIALRPYGSAALFARQNAKGADLARREAHARHRAYSACRGRSPRGHRHPEFQPRCREARCRRAQPEPMRHAHHIEPVVRVSQFPLVAEREQCLMAAGATSCLSDRQDFCRREISGRYLIGRLLRTCSRRTNRGRAASAG
jgi:hypothetical protein